MGILDDLRKTSSKKKVTEHNQKHQEKHLENIYQTEILPKMQMILSYFMEVVDHLNFIEMKIQVPEYSKKYPQLGLLTQSHYKINTDGLSGLVNVNRLMQINLTFTCVAEGSFSYNLCGKSSVEREISYLHSKHALFNWKYDDTVKAEQAAIFTMERKIPIRFRFEANYDTSEIKISIHNHECFSVYHKSFPPEQIDEDFLDKIARYLLRQDSEFIMLEISEKQKQSIRAHAEKIQRENAFAKQRSDLKKSQKPDRVKSGIFGSRIKNLMQQIKT